MPFDPGTNTWGINWGNMGGWGSPQGNIGGGTRIPSMGRPGFMQQTFDNTWSTRYDPVTLGQQNQRSSMNSQTMQQQDAMFNQGINERNMALQHKYGMQQLQAQLEAQKWAQMMGMYAQGMALPSAEQIERSRGDLAGSLADYQRYADQGRYSPEQMNTLSQDAWNQINTGARNNAMTMNNQLASMGLSANPGAAAALGMAGRFAANAQRGSVMADLERENAQAREWGVAGKAGINSQMADYASRPINRMANFDPWGMFSNDDERKKNQKPPMAYGSGDPWTPRVGGA